MDKIEKRNVIRELIWAKVDQVVSYENRKNAIECDFSPDECLESHLPGDCPLCGGE